MPEGEVAERLTEGTTTRRGAADFTAIFSAKKISFLRFRTRVWRWSTASIRLIPVGEGSGPASGCDHDSHYLCEDDAHAQDVMLCIQTGSRFKRRTDEVRRQPVFRQERRRDAACVQGRAAGDLAHAGIAERCNLRLEKIPSPFPHFDVPDGYTIDSYFEHITRQGFARRMENLRARRRAVGSSIRWQSTNRDWPELAIIQQMKFSGIS